MKKLHFIAKRALFAFALLVVIGVVIRISTVNASAEKMIMEEYAQNEWVELGGSYFRSFEENTEGYSIMVTDYEIMDKQSYLDKYDLESDSISEENAFSYIMEVSVKIHNDGNTDGKIQIGDWALIGTNNDYVTWFDKQLLMDSDERIDEYLSSVTTTQERDVEVRLPFPLIFIDDANEMERNAPYKLAVTKYPVRKYVYINIEKGLNKYIENQEDEQ